jgi:2-keto-4-pentenoate hydratase/2-oxohepta-3-ene-1,7-dioic acid hydratase in catechol pathway
MKLASYRFTSNGGVVADSYGVVTDDEVTDIRAVSPDAPATLRGFLGADPSLRATLTAADAPSLALAEVELLPVIPDPAKIVCIGVNYADHRAETDRPVVAYPTIFTRFADTQVGHSQPAVKPKASDSMDYEGELAVVIGAPAWEVSEADALGVVAGYSCYDDFSIRDWQRHTSQFIPGKNFPGTGGFGPWLVTADEIPDPSALHLTTRVNGDVRQSADVKDLIFDIPALIAYVTSFTALSPGDVMITGTPGGVGQHRQPPEFLQPGDVVEVEITSIGTLRNPVI